MTEKESGLKRFGRLILRALPLIGLACAAIWLWASDQELTVDGVKATVLSYTNARPLLAALFMLLLYGLKSLSLMLPILLLDAVCGLLFPLPVAVLVASLGTGITLTIPYFIGRGAGPDMTARLMKKYERLRELREMRRRNEFFCAFLVRVMGILPCDVVSLYLGNTRMPYWKFVVGGVLGFLPDVVTAVMVGGSVDDPTSPQFLWGIGVNLLVVVCATSFYFFYRRHISKAAPQPEDASDGSAER